MVLILIRAENGTTATCASATGAKASASASSSGPSGTWATPAEPETTTTTCTDIVLRIEEDISTYTTKITTSEEAPQTRLDTTLEIERSWLTPHEFFEAQLERWQHGSGQPHVVVAVPALINVVKGGRLLKLRLAAEQEYKKKVSKDGEESVQDTAYCNCEVKKRWWATDWRKAAKNDVEALVAALYVFDMAVLQSFGQEVAETLEMFRYPCSEAVAALADRYCVADLVIAQPTNAISERLLTIDIIDGLINNAIQREDKHSMELAARALVGVEPTRALAMVLVDNLDRAIDSIPSWGPQVRCDAVPWLLQQCELLVRRNPRSAYYLADACTKRFQHDLGWSFMEIVDVACQVVFRSLHILLLESVVPDGQEGLEPPNIEVGLAAMRRLVREVENWTWVVNWGYWFRPQVFAVASPLAQYTCLKCMPEVSSCDVFRGNLDLVHEGARYLFLDRVRYLGSDDIRFLSTTSFTDSFLNNPDDSEEDGSRSEVSFAPQI